MTPDPVLLQAAGETDLDALLSLERRSYSHPWSPRAFREALGDPERGRVLILRSPAAGEPDAGIRAYCVYQTVVDEMHIHNLAVHPGHRGRGLGRRLLKLVLGIGARRGARTALLEVRQSNWAALHLYRSMGFQIVSVRRAYYERPSEDALVLERTGLAAEGSGARALENR